MSITERRPCGEPSQNGWRGHTDRLNVTLGGRNAHTDRRHALEALKIDLKASYQGRAAVKQLQLDPVSEVELALTLTLTLTLSLTLIQP